MTTEKQPLLSICIPSYNRADLLEYCLENLSKLDSYDIDYEIVVVNHASPDNTAEMLAQAQKKYLRLRVFHQTHQVGLGAQHVACLRMGRGEFIVFLADDDKFVLDVLVRYTQQLKANPHIAALYAPWWAYDDAEEKILHGYFTVPERSEFKKGNEEALFKFMVERNLYPEECIYRRSALMQVCFLINFSPVHNFLWIIELIKQGSIVFETEVFKLEVAVVKPQFARASRLNLEMTIARVDNTRAALEQTALRAIHASGGDQIAQQARIAMHEILLNYLHERVNIAFLRAIQRGDYLEASHLGQRLVLWHGIDFRPDAKELVVRCLFGAGFQASGYLLKALSWKHRLIAFGFKPDDPIESVLAQQYPDITVERMEEGEIRQLATPEEAVLFVKRTSQKALFEEMFGLGSVVSMEEAIEYYKIYPISYTLD